MRLVVLAVGVVLTLLCIVPFARAESVYTENEGSIYVANVPGRSENLRLNGENTKGYDIGVNSENIVYAPQTGPNAGDLLVRHFVQQTTSVVSTPATTGLFWSEPRWAPGGQILGRAEDGIYSINEDGSHLRRLSTFGEWPTMSLNGYLAFMNGNNNLYIISPVKSVEEVGQLTHISVPGPAGHGVIPSFSRETANSLYVPTKDGLREYNPTTDEEGYFFPSLKDQQLQVRDGDAYGCEETGFAVAYSLGSEKPEFPGYQPCTTLRLSEYQSSEAVPPGVEPSNEELLEEFAPIVKYDYEEPYRAISPNAEVETVGYAPHEEGKPEKVEYANQLKRGSTVLADPLYGDNPEEIGYTPKGFFQLSLGTLGANYPVSVNESEGTLATSEDYLDEHDGTEEEDADHWTPSRETAEALGHVVHTPTGDWVQYWFYYYYNIGQFGVDDHEGDWEMVQIFLTRNSGFLRDKMVFSQHSHDVLCERGEYETEGEGPGFGGRPVVYSAYGSHASYPKEGYYQTEVEGFDDSAIYHPEQEESSSVTLYGMPDSYGTYPSWVYWPGKWGGSEASPTGPLFHQKQWGV